MDVYRAFLAIILSFLILIGYQYFFVKPLPQQPQQQAGQEQKPQQEKSLPPAQKPAGSAAGAAISAAPVVTPDPSARDIRVITPLYRAVISEQGGGIRSFVLTRYRTEMTEGSGNMQLVTPGLPVNELPGVFSLDGGQARLPLFRADREQVEIKTTEERATLTLTATEGSGLTIVRTLTFHGDSYLIEQKVEVRSTASAPVAISPALVMENAPFSHNSASSRYLFRGPAAYVDGKLVQIKEKKLADGPRVLTGAISWAGYMDNYFIMALIPPAGSGHTVTVSRLAPDRVRTVIAETGVTLEPGKSLTLEYASYFGPKKLTILKSVNHDLAGSVNFGWFDILAKPMLWLLNLFHAVIGNYGIAIILLTVLIKLVFWPITQKGMRSMKNMQKLQPKVAKLKEKYKDDPARMNQEMMALYKTYKVNPVGGCLPMFIQIPFFFALYRVLMAAIELRHAPFMLWINDLSAPDRLMIPGFDIPYIHGIPVLTLLMGASMYLQQKMTPTTADPTQARIMQFLPVVFTFMFINFASGLVLYWFINNLLSILQQVLINRQQKTA